MAAKNDKKKEGIPPRNKQSYAQYVWIRHMFTRIDAIDARLDKIEKELAENRKVNIVEQQPSSKANE